MNKLITMGTMAFSVAGLGFLLATGCGGGGATSIAAPQSRSYLGTQNPGDVWQWTLTGTSFTASNQTRGYTYSGTEQTLVSGFLKLTFTSSTDPNVSVNSLGYGLEIPGTAIIIKPAGDQTVKPILGAALGGCPATAQNFNFVKVPSATFDLSSQPAYGTLTIDPSSGSLTGTISWFALSGTSMGSGQDSFTCSNGTWQGTDSTGAWSPGGVFFIDNGLNNGGSIGVAAPSANIDLSDMTSRTFRGFLISPAKTEPVAAIPSGTSGTMLGHGYDTDDELTTDTPDVANASVTITFTSQPSPGLVAATIQPNNGNPESIVCAVNITNGKYTLYSIGGSSSQVYNLYLIEK
jgi:hypothetical protein